MEDKKSIRLSRKQESQEARALNAALEPEQDPEPEKGYS